MANVNKNYFKIRMNKVFSLYNSISKTNIKILDVGCDTEYLLERIKNENQNVELYGCDIQSLNRQNIIQCDIEEGLPYKDNHFDVIFLCEVIEHLKNDDFVLREIKRCIKKGGYLILTTPNVTSFQKRVQFLFGIVPSDLKVRYHIRFNNFKTITIKLKKAGFNVKKKITSNIPYPIRFKIFKNIAIRLGDYFYSLGNHIIILSKSD